MGVKANPRQLIFPHIETIKKAIPNELSLLDKSLQTKKIPIIDDKPHIDSNNAKQAMEDVKLSLISKIFRMLIPNDHFMIRLLGQGAFGVVYTDSKNQYVVKLSKLPALGDHSQVYCSYFQREVRHKTIVYKTYVKLLKSGIVSLSTLLYIDPGTYGEYCLIQKTNSTFKIKRCWISMKRIIMCPSTEHKQSSRQMLYDGDLTENMAEIIHATAQIYAIHLIGARLRIAKDLELVVGVDSDDNRIVSLIDYGQILPLYEKGHRLYKKILRVSVILMRKNVPLVGEKYIIFRSTFLDIASALDSSKFGKRILRILVPPKKKNRKKIEKMKL